MTEGLLRIRILHLLTFISITPLWQQGFRRLPDIYVFAKGAQSGSPFLACAVVQSHNPPAPPSVLELRNHRLMVRIPAHRVDAERAQARGKRIRQQQKIAAERRAA